ncbi:DUF7096 domain-containing protein [Halorussus litoreus]|uniref:DUF7096 domain-containing protein n=1 Tax=Halorussus litoreus TaxID=1710536 RepID=UPI000E235CC8|nr:hypothetical protein [Halorussus litoreus]
MRHIPVMLALLLALSPGAVAFQAAAPSASVAAESPPEASVAESPSDVTSAARTDAVQPAPNGNTTNVMTLGTEPTRSAFDSPTLALGESLATKHNDVRAQLSIDSLDEQLKNTDRTEQKKRILNRYRYRIENRIISLKASERQVATAFSNGTLSKTEYLYALGRIDAEAEDTHRKINALKERASTTDFAFDARSVKTKLVTLEGPVRDHVLDAMKGGQPSTKIYVATNDNGVVLAMLRNGEYVREVYRADNRDSSSNGQMSFEEAENEVLGQQFPWVLDINNINGAQQRQYSSLSVLRFIYFHQHGELTAYVDTSTEKIYRTIQQKQLFGENSLPPGPAVNESAENLTLSVSRTYSGGPLRVKLTNATGAPVQGEISIDGEPIGRTTENGVLWTLGPNEEFRAGATYDGRTVNVTTTPVDAASSSNVTTALVDSA